MHYNDFYEIDNLYKLDEEFIKYINSIDSNLYNHYINARQNCTLRNDELTLLIAPLVESFLGNKFQINNQLKKTYHEHSSFALIAYAKRQFIQRYVIKNFPEIQEEWQHLHNFENDYEFAKIALHALENNSNNLEILAKFAAWCTLSKYGQEKHKESSLFKFPEKINPDFILKNVENNNGTYYLENTKTRNNFSLTDSGFSNKSSAIESHYCIICNKQGKDSCRAGIKNIQQKSGCPLDENISLMHALKKEGLNIAALAVITVDNPMVAATGHRICNDCMASCIFQKQDPVNTPAVETNILDSVLNYDYGFEIYSLLTKWNPLNFENPLPKKNSKYKVLVVGLGPSGFSMAHYLARDGHTVIGIDAAKLEPLQNDNVLIKNITSINENLNERIISGFGGVAEYGITVRWNKNYLKILRLILERNSNIKFFGSLRFNSQINENNFKSLGFDEFVICTGAGKPNIPSNINHQLPGVRLASDFLMNLQLIGAFKSDILSNLQLLTPIVVIGGGLSAIDAATEAKAYFKVQREKILKLFDQIVKTNGIDNVQKWWTKKDFDSFENLKNNLEADVKIIYRNEITKSPSYQQNHLEIEHALSEGIIFLENHIPLRFETDSNGWVSGIWVDNNKKQEFIKAKSIILALGSETNKISHEFTFGDANPQHAGNVVKAIASAKNGYKNIVKKLKIQKPNPIEINLENFNSYVLSKKYLSDNIIEIAVKSPLAAKTFKPGQFFKLQNFETNAKKINGFKMYMEPIALTPFKVDPDKGIITFVIVMIGASSKMVQFLSDFEEISITGPVGTPTKIENNETILIIGGGQFNIGLINIAKALKQNKNKVIWIAGYTKESDIFYQQEIKKYADYIYFCIFKNDEKLTSNYIKGTVIDGLNSLNNKMFDKIIISGPTPMQKALKEYFKTSPIKSKNNMCNINTPMQCMMHGLCGQCLHTTNDNQSIFCCQHQDIELENINFNNLENKSSNNNLAEKITNLWVQSNCFKT